MVRELFEGDCLEIMSEIPDKSIDMILADLPYGITAWKNDIIIPFKPLWNQYKRIIKDRGAIVLTASQPFSSILIMSNIDMFSYEWIWVKSKITGVLNAKKMPVRKHEQILVFSDNKTTGIYNAQGLKRKGTITKQGRGSINYNERSELDYVQEFTNWPRDVLEIKSPGKTVHPTQKPVALFEYLIKTYTNEGDIVLDNVAGSGTTGEACDNTNRQFILIEKEKKYCDIIRNRLNIE